MIFYYITAHGFGHAVRACEVIRNLPAPMPLTLRTNVPEWFLASELTGRRFELRPARFDCGTLGPDSSRIDLARTMERVEALLSDEGETVEREAQLLKASGARLVVSDVPWMPLRAARAAGIPSILIANFTWSAIYQHLADHFCPEAALRARTLRAIEKIQAGYDEGDLLLATDMSIAMRACRARRDVPMVARRGRNRREALVEGLGLRPDRRIVLLYLGREGIEGVAWEQLSAWPEFQFIAYAPPREAGGWIKALPEELIDHSDVVASVDAVLAKPGYGICGECIATGTPLAYLTRPQFAEIHAVEALMARWGGGVRIEEEDFKALRWGETLERLRAIKVEPEAIDCSGGEACARIIREMIGDCRL